MCICVEVECFPADATVDVFDIGQVKLSSLKIGARVRIIDDNNQITYSPIIAFLHRELNEQAIYKEIRTSSTQIHVSNRHLIYRRNDGFVWAETLSEGDEILVLSSKYSNKTNWEEIIDINDVNKQGLMAPLTEQGTIIVNNVHASCYAVVKYHYLGHMALAPYRWYHRLFGRTAGINTTPILTYANILFQFFKNLPIVKEFIF
jgi:hypothetical protein